MYPQQSFRFTTFSPSSFWAHRRQVVRKVSLRYQLEVLKKTGRYDCFKLKWHPIYDEGFIQWPVPKHLFWDSDVAKWIEAACYFLHEEFDLEIDEAVKELVEMIRSAQQPDGYLNVHFTVVKPGERFTNLRDLHELYNAGHLIEAALVHHLHYGNDRLLEPVIRYVNLICQMFGPGENQKHGYPGHPEIELALLRLYEVTRDPSHLALARYFIEERGNPTGQDGEHYYTVEAQARGERENEIPQYFPARKSYWYMQAHKPLLEQETIEGHSVRAMYLLTALADLVRVDKVDPGYREALLRLWRNMVDKKMYVTGGIGVIKQYEGFGPDYFLPQGTDEGGCYAETCAAIGVVMLAERLLQVDLDGQYADIMELCLYNAVLTGMSHNGKAFTYVNQLASSDKNPSERHEWFECSCCPPNVTRTLGILGGYLWTFDTSDDPSLSASINVHMYASAALTFKVAGQTLALEQATNWPWEGTVKFKYTGPRTVACTVRLRIPSWASDFTLDPPLEDPIVNKSYLTIPPTYLAKYPTFSLTVSGFQPRLLVPHPYTNQNTLTVARGPIIYCLEDVDNPWVKDNFKSTLLDPHADLTESQTRDDATGEFYVAISAIEGGRFLDLSHFASTKTPCRPCLYPTGEVKHISGLPNGNAEKGSVSSEGRNVVTETLNFIPYYFRANRGGTGQMRVGIRALGPLDRVLRR
ncbi:hypothetical protein VTO42DRAFT_6824 [Malbranchea cinnamomea]